jgi:hypothetical protein
MSTRRTTYITIAVIAAVFTVLAATFLVHADRALEATTGFLSHWFFAIFCVLFALTQARVYLTRRRQQARLANHVPTSAFGFFTALWCVLALAAIVYGVLGLEGWWEIAGWATLVLVICVQLIVLGKLMGDTKLEAQ